MTEHVRQTPSPLPAPPGHDILTANQWGVLNAIADTVVPSLTLLEGNRLLKHPLRKEIYEASCRRLEQQCISLDHHNLAVDYLQELATTQSEFQDGIRRLVNVHLPEDARKQLSFILTTLRYAIVISPVVLQPAAIHAYVRVLGFVQHTYIAV